MQFTHFDKSQSNSVHVQMDTEPAFTSTCYWKREYSSPGNNPQMPPPDSHTHSPHQTGLELSKLETGDVALVQCIGYKATRNYNS